MPGEIFVKSFEALAFDDSEIRRYAGQTKSSFEFEELVFSCKKKLSGLITPRLCYSLIGKNEINYFVSKAAEGSFKSYFDACEKGIVFAGTLGLGFDRALFREERISMSSAFVMQAIGAQQIEELCNCFCREIKEKYPSSKPRFSPGYGGLGLEAQKDIFKLLDCQKNIGLSLNESLLMSPVKSVTAFIAIS